MFPKVTKEKSETLGGRITGKELLFALPSMGNSKLTGNDGLTKEFYKTFWNELKVPLLTGDRKNLSCKTTHCIAKTSSNTLIEKKGRSKR